MGLYDVLRPLAFLSDAETAHELALGLISRGVVRTPRFEHPCLRQELFGVRFENPLGLAAGFDKNGMAVEEWGNLGFGFAEIGTATPQPQAGNPRPRMFRIPEEEALINRLGFNSEGAKTVAVRIRESRSEIPLGVNIGKNASTPLEGAVKDYVKCFKLLAPLASYVVVNVSSPNTPGLRELQDKGPLLEIVSALRAVDHEKPLFVKVSPDLSAQALDDVIGVAVASNLAGIVATNTTVSREMLRADPGIPGGLSGRPLARLADDALEYLYKGCGRDKVLIGVGGISSGEDVFRKMALGASLCQAYTGFVYGGPAFASRCLSELAALMEERGVRSLAELRGSQAAGSR